MYKLFTDGGARGNPGPAGIGGVIFKNNEPIYEFSEYIGIATNNVAEYKALLSGLKYCNNISIKELKIFMDSELVVKQIKGEYRINKVLEIYKIYLQIIEELKTISFTIEHIPRNLNSHADALVNKALDGQYFKAKKV